MKIIGLAGRAGAGKSLVASMLPGGFRVIGFADPIYRGLSAMLDLQEDDLRGRETKETAIDWLGVSPRELAQTVGTDWGRDLIADDLWVTLARRRVKRLHDSGVRRIAFADVRFANEVEFIRDEMGGEVWLVDRPGAETTPHAHRSEDGLPADAIDRTIVNDCNLDELRRRVEAAFRAAHP